MKFASFATAAALVAVANSQNTACDVASLQPLLASPDTTTCASDSGYAVTSLSTPTAAQLTSMCASTGCQSVLTQLESLAPSECTLGAFALYADLIDPLKAACSGGAATTGSGAATTGSAAAPMPAVGSTAGSSTTATVTASSTGSAASITASSGSSTPEEAASSSSTASSTAAASASASASSSANIAAVSAGAIVVAVAATFF
uniref:Elicitin-like protein n=1 Tax=Phytophthora brassicae TaxID=187813 RepID=Q84JU3_PHYBB|nr:elicitin-like protein [Phytophthora brassicae]AAO92428.1 elicitin-like protein [Phytophthora brassicae]ABB55928.1 elicitin-like protein BRL1B [Phytophthora brassicae]